MVYWNSKKSSPVYCPNRYSCFAFFDRFLPFLLFALMVSLKQTKPYPAIHQMRQCDCFDCYIVSRSAKNNALLIPYLILVMPQEIPDVTVLIDVNLLQWLWSADWFLIDPNGDWCNARLLLIRHWLMDCVIVESLLVLSG